MRSFVISRGKLKGTKIKFLKYFVHCEQSFSQYTCVIIDVEASIESGCAKYIAVSIRQSSILATPFSEL